MDVSTNSEKQKKIIFVVGPTAVGKSSFVLRTAPKYQSGVVNADSLQFFKDLNIGTAKPSVDEMKT